MSIDIPPPVFHNPTHQAGNTRHHDEVNSFGIPVWPTRQYSWAWWIHHGICEETRDKAVLMKDKSGRVIGFEKLNFSVAKSEQLRVAFETVAVWRSFWPTKRSSGWRGDAFSLSFLSLGPPPLIFAVAHGREKIPMRLLKRTNRFYDTSRFGQPQVRGYLG
jgi:hypothetical protein